MDAIKKTEVQVKPLTILFPMLITAFLGMFSEMSLSIALSTLMDELNVGTTTIQWLTTGFMLVISILVPVSALLIQTFSTRKLILTSTILFTIGTIIAALAGNFTILLIGRLIQAIGTGITIPLLFNTVLVVTPPQKRGSMMGIVGLVVMFAPAIAPTLSGIIMQQMSWQWLFWVLVPFLIINIILILSFCKNVTTLTKPKIDVFSVFLSTIGFGGIVYGFSSAGEGESGWSNPLTIFSLIIGFVALIIFVYRQLRMNNPLLNLRAFKYPMFTLGAILVMFSMMIIFSFNLLMPMYLQNGLMVSVMSIGLLMLPAGILNGIMSPITGILFDKFGPKWLVIIGLGIISIVLYTLTTISSTTGFITIILLHCILLVGVSMTMMPSQTNGLNQLPRDLYPHGTAIMNTLQQLAGAIGTALCVSIMAAGQNSYLKNLTSGQSNPSELSNAFINGVQNSFMFIAIIATIGFICALFIRKSHTEN